MPLPYIQKAKISHVSLPSLRNAPRHDQLYRENVARTYAAYSEMRKSIRNWAPRGRWWEFRLGPPTPHPPERKAHLRRQPRQPQRSKLRNRSLSIHALRRRDSRARFPHHQNSRQLRYRRLRNHKADHQLEHSSQRRRVPAGELCQQPSPLSGTQGRIREQHARRAPKEAASRRLASSRSAAVGLTPETILRVTRRDVRLGRGILARRRYRVQ